MFKQDLCDKILAGEKTQTRRPVSDNPRSPWFKDACQLEVGRDYAVCPGRGIQQVGRVRVTDIRKEEWAGISEPDAIAEGFKAGTQPYIHKGGTAVTAFIERVSEMYERDPDFTFGDECWVIEFELISVTWDAIEEGADVGGSRLVVIAPTIDAAMRFGYRWRDARDGRKTSDVIGVYGTRTLRDGLYLDRSVRVVQVGPDVWIKDRPTIIDQLRRAMAKSKTPLHVVRITEDA